MLRTVFCIITIFIWFDAPAAVPIDCSLALTHRISYWIKPGKYKGLTPSDESPVAAGEIEMVVSKNGEVQVRVATGLGIQSGSFDLRDYVLMTEAERAEHVSPENAAEAIGFRPKKGADGPGFIFPKEKNLMMRLLGAPVIMRMGMGDMLGPTLLVTPRMRGVGLHRLTLFLLERRGDPEPGHVSVPRLRYGGTTDRSRR